MKRAYIIYFLIIFLSILAGIFSSKISESISLSGGCDQSNSPYLNHINKVHKISYCQGGDSDLGSIVSDPFILRESLEFWYSGYPNMKGQEVLISPVSGDPLIIKLPDVGNKWVFYRASIPVNFQGREVTFVANDYSTDIFGWLGISNLTNTSSPMLNSLAAGLAKIFVIGLLFHSVLAVMLSVFLCRYIIDLAVPLFLVSFGLVGYTAFFLYFWNVSFGIGFSIFCLLLIILIFINLMQVQKLYIFILSLKLLMPVFVLTIFIVFVGYFPFDRVGPDDWETGANRWLSLPVDNWISKIFADQIWSGQVQRPMFGDWLSSDRGPLQTGIVLIFYPFFPKDGLLYQTLATMLQTLILFPAWLVLRKLSIHQKAEFLFILGFSSLVVLNSLFVWPKLLSATYVILAYLYLQADRKQISFFHYIFVIGGSSALAMLSHGGAIFPLVVLGLMYLIDTIRSSDYRRHFYIGIMCFLFFLLILVPWLVYGKLIDHSNGRLLKWHFAGHIPPTEIPLYDLLLIAYQNINFTEWIQGKIKNFEIIFAGNLVSDIFAGGDDIKKNSFFAFNYSMWFFSFYFVIPVWIFARFPLLPVGISRLLIISLCSLMVWIVVMFEPGSTIIHQGSFFPWIVIFLVLCIILKIASLFLFRLALFGNLLIIFVFYVAIVPDVSFDLTIFYYTFCILFIGLFFRFLIYLDENTVTSV